MSFAPRLIHTAVMFTLIAPVAAQVEMRVGAVAGQPGQQVVVPVFVKNGAELSALELDLAFDSQVLSCPTVSSLAMAGELSQDHVAVGTVGPGFLHVTVFSPSLAPFRGSQGAAAQVLLSISPSAQPGSTHSLTVTNAKACSPLGEAVQLVTVNGTLKVGDPPGGPEEGQNRLVFPQLANGSAGPGAFYTLLALLNKTGAPGRIRVRFCLSGGEPMVVRLLDAASGSEFERDLPAGGTCLLETDGQGSLAAGYALVDSTVPLGGSGMFGWAADDGKVITEAGVGPSTGQFKYLVPILYRKGVSSTGLALANTGKADKQLSLRLLESSGKEAAAIRVPLGAQAHFACFVHEAAMFPVLTGQDSFVGVLEISADPDVRVTALKQSSQEGLITTLSLVGVE